MAFHTPPPEAITWGAAALPGGVARLTRQHNDAVAKLLEAADASAGPIDTALTLAAIKAYREAMAGTEEKPGPRDTMHRLARYLIAAGVAPGRVCRQLGYGRTAMNKAMAEDKDVKTLIYPGRKSVKKRVA